MMAYLGRPFGMSNKPHSKILLNAASFYLRGRLGGKNLLRNSRHVRNANLPLPDF